MTRTAAEAVESLFEEPELVEFAQGTAGGRTDDDGLVSR
jgi:hypothetical protein